MKWQQIGTDWYLKLESGRNFQDSLDKCISLGGHLAVIRDQASHDAIYSLAGENLFSFLFVRACAYIS